MVAETRRSIEAGVAAGVIDPDVSAGPIEAVLKIAEAIDDPEFPFAGGKLDNVSLPTYLRYCTELRLTPASVGEKKEGAGGKLAQLRSIESARRRA